MTVLQTYSEFMTAVGRLCGVCDDGYGVTLDLQACSPSGQCAAGLVLFLFLCKIQ